MAGVSTPNTIALLVAASRSLRREKGKSDTISGVGLRGKYSFRPKQFQTSLVPFASVQNESYPEFPHSAAVTDTWYRSLYCCFIQVISYLRRTLETYDFLSKDLYPHFRSTVCCKSFCSRRVRGFVVVSNGRRSVDNLH